MREPAEPVEYVEWETFLNDVFKWKQGEHMTLIGPTGGGKTTLTRLLLPRRHYQLVVATKAQDPLIQEMKQDHEYSVVKEFDVNADITPKVILYPAQKQSLSATRANQRSVIAHAIESAYHQKAWCIYIDEGNYVCEDLRLADDLKTIWHTGRSLNISLVVSLQRPTMIPLVAYSGATHLIFWRNNDEADLKRIGGIGGINNRTIREAVSALEWHEVLYVNTRSGRLCRTKAKVSGK